jgi:hypothetical protein
MKAVATDEPRREAIRTEQPIGSPSFTGSILKGNTWLVVENVAALRELEVQFLGSSELAGCRRLDASPRHSEWF